MMMMMMLYSGCSQLPEHHLPGKNLPQGLFTVLHQIGSFITHIQFFLSTILEEMPYYGIQCTHHAIFTEKSYTLA
jgi:hypothetical protein